jgi:hypothetical protein
MSNAKPETPDAIRAPIGFAGPGDSYMRLTKLQDEFAKVLKVARVYVRHQGIEHFLTGDPADTLLFPGGSARSGESRYEWKDRGDGVQYGYLKAEG